MAVNDDLEEIRSALESVIERLDDVAFTALREAVRRGETKRPDVERRVTRARNAIHRAVGLLGTDDQTGPDDLDD